MPKIYTKNTWQDEELADEALYNITESDDTPFKLDMKIALSTDVIQAGTVMTAEKMNNVENGIDELDTKLADAQNLLTTGGSSTAYTITTIGGATLETGETFRVKFHATAGALPTLNRDSKGAKSLKYYDANGTKQACTSAQIIANMILTIIYDGVDYVILGGASAGNNGWNTIASTLTPASQAYTNDPAAGELITLNMTDTSKFFVGDGVIVSSSAGAEMAIVTSLVANTSITVSKLALNHTTTNPVVIAFAVDTSADETANIQKGDKIRISQSTSKYFFVYSVTSSRITFLPTSTNLLTTASITAGYYSHIENPTGWIGSLSFVPRFFRGTTDFTNDPTVSMKYSVINDKLSGTIDFTMPASAGGSGPIYCSVPAIILFNSVMIGLEFTTGASITITASSSGNALTFYTISPVAVIPDTSGYKYVGSFEYIF